MTILFLCCLIHIGILAQEHVINGPVHLKLYVIKKGKYYNIDSLCTGYDEYGVPQNLVIPSGSSLVLDGSNRKDDEVYEYRTSGEATTFYSVVDFPLSGVAYYLVLDGCACLYSSVWTLPIYSLTLSSETLLSQ